MIISSKLITVMENDIKEAKEKLKSCNINKETVKTLCDVYSPYIKDTDGKGTKIIHQVQTNSESNVKMNINIDFEQAITLVNEDTSLDDKTTQEIIEKIKPQKKSQNQMIARKNKWKSLKTIVIWIAEKSVDIVAKLLPFIMDALQ